MMATHTVQLTEICFPQSGAFEFSIVARRHDMPNTVIVKHMQIGDLVIVHCQVCMLLMNEEQSQRNKGLREL